MKKIIFFIITSVILINFCFSQDLITLSTNEVVSAKVLEITTSEVKYKKFDNLNGPTFSILKSEVIMIQYENGTKDIINKSLLALDEALLKISIENPMELTKKGNKVFIEIPDEPSRCGEAYFIEALNEWGYWTIVKNVNEAHFIIILKIKKKAMLNKSVCVIFKTRENKEFKKSKRYKEGTSIFNGYNAYKGAAQKVVSKYLKKQFK